METAHENFETPSSQIADPTTPTKESPNDVADHAESDQKHPDAILPSQRTVLSDRLRGSRQYETRYEYSLQDANQAAERIATYTLENDDVNPGYALLLQSVVLGLKPLSPISMDKHVQEQQLKNAPPHRIFQYQGLKPQPKTPLLADPSALSPLGSDSVDSLSQRKPPRRIAKTPYKVLDAPALQDDFYLNLVDWSSNNILAVGLGACVYLWNADTSIVTKLCDLSQVDSVCSVAFSQRSTYLSVGTVEGEVQVWDVQTLKKVHTFSGHKGRVGTMAWSTTHLTTGSRDHRVLHHDIRSENVVHELLCHKSEVCGLKWSGDDRQLASGGNDNQLCIWELRAPETPVIVFSEHTAAVKAIAWSPHQHGLLASGGGTADRHIRFWNTATEQSLDAIDTGSQVCNLAWSRNVNEIVSSHGYSQNQVIVWKHPEMTKLAILPGHSSRVMYLAVSPDGQTIVTGAGDETLRFWSVFPPLHHSRGSNISMHSNFR